MSIGKNIRDLRWDRHLKQGELARRVGIAQNTLSRIELGRATPSVHTLERIAEELGVASAELLREPAEAIGAGKGSAPEPGLPISEEAEAWAREWAKERRARLHGLSDEEWSAHVRALDVDELAQEFRNLLDEAKMLHAALSHDKWVRPEGRERRMNLGRGLRYLRTYRFADLEAAALLRHAENLVNEIHEEMLQQARARDE